MLNGVPQRYRGKILHSEVRGLWSHACHILKPKQTLLDHPMPFGIMVNGWYYCALLQDKVRPALGHKQLGLLEHGATVCQDKETPHRHCDVQNVVPLWCAKCGATLGLGNIGTASLLSRSHPMWLLVVAHVKEHVQWKRFESEDNINTAVTASLHHLKKDEYRAAIDHLT